MVVVVIILNWTGTMLAFVNKTLSRLQSNRPLVETGDTQVIAK